MKTYETLWRCTKCNAGGLVVIPTNDTCIQIEYAELQHSERAPACHDEHAAAALALQPAAGGRIRSNAPPSGRAIKEGGRRGMTRARLEEVKAKPHGPTVADLITEIEQLWTEQAFIHQRVSRQLAERRTDETRTLLEVASICRAAATERGEQLQ
jgi:hypothetical protein